MLRFVRDLDVSQTCYVQGRPEDSAGAEFRELTAERIYAIDSAGTPLAFVEYQQTDDRVTISWVASWGRENGHRGVAAAVLRETLAKWDAAGISTVKAMLICRKKDPTWLLAAQLNLFYGTGFEMRYWAWDKRDELVYHLKRRN